jgi:hypothetical protein
MLPNEMSKSQEHHDVFIPLSYRNQANDSKLRVHWMTTNYNRTNWGYYEPKDKSRSESKCGHRFVVYTNHLLLVLFLEQKPPMFIRDQS